MDTHFDVLVLGTGLINSILAAALSKSGLKVVHIDTNAYYGSDEASLSQEEIIEWAQKRASSRTSTATTISSPTPLPFARSYALSLAPALVASVGPLISAIVLSGVARYGQFKLLDAVFVCKGMPGVDEARGLEEPSPSQGQEKESKDGIDEAVTTPSQAEPTPSTSQPLPTPTSTSTSTPNLLTRVPATKEDIFRTRSISPIIKRKLMRFLQFAA
ncbi:hypothetical protein M422DRAFT_255395, partial [Sphaerobolus stellatus SS14]